MKLREIIQNFLQELRNSRMWWNFKKGRKLQSAGTSGSAGTLCVLREDSLRDDGISHEAFQYGSYKVLGLQEVLGLCVS